jgi:ribonuclease HI
MELLSVINGLKALEKPCRVDIYSDSQYVIHGLRDWMDGWKKKGWKRTRSEPVKNVELWKELDELRQKHQLSYHWIRGHNEHPENERCDRMAVEAIRRYST